LAEILRALRYLRIGASPREIGGKVGGEGRLGSRGVLEESPALAISRSVTLGSFLSGLQESVRTKTLKKSLGEGRGRREIDSRFPKLFLYTIGAFQFVGLAGAMKRVERTEFNH